MLHYSFRLDFQVVLICVMIAWNGYIEGFYKNESISMCKNVTSQNFNYIWI